jgi:triacylglycerol esterase/lipase EstA (alpha/beta hydrolase family)
MIAAPPAILVAATMHTAPLDWLLILCCLAGLSPRSLHAQGLAAGRSQPQAVPQQSVPQAPVHPRVIVFVHGLHGSRDSWRAANGAYWPDLVQTDPRFAYSDVVVAEYPSPSSNGKMSSVQLADILYTHLRQAHVWDHREVVFIAHSLGGILVEEMLLRHPADAARVRFVVSYGTPHEGSTVARVASTTRILCSTISATPPEMLFSPNWKTAGAAAPRSTGSIASALMKPRTRRPKMGSSAI